jgi:drug/metabolite transporter (DMT)-like permease
METRSLIYLGLYSVMLAMGHILQKMVLNLGVDQFVFAFIRIATGFLVISLLLLVKEHHPIMLVKKNIRHFFVLGVCFSGFGILLKFWGISLTTATNAAFIMSLSSVAVVIFAFLLLKEKAPKQFYTIVMMMIAGVYLVTTGGRQLLPQIGDIIIFVLAFLIGFMQVYGKKVLETLSVIQTAFGRSFIGMIFLGLLIPIFSPKGFSTIPSIPVLLLVMANGITFSSSVILFYKALQTERASNTGMFALLVPILTAVLGYFFLTERLNFFQIIGGLIILTGSHFISKIKISIGPSGH